MVGVASFSQDLSLEATVLGSSAEVSRHPIFSCESVHGLGRG